MEKEVRNRIQRATQAARQLLEEEYREQLEGVFDILLDGSIAPEPGSHLSAEQRVVREKLVAVVAHKRASGLGPGEAVAAFLREAAFTMLNRLVALKMLEARELVQECVSKGEESSGFREFLALASGLGALPDKGYQLYIESLFDEIGREVGILFDRRDVASLLWPRRQALLELLAILNDAELSIVWPENETIGWVYQYFNSDDERKQMRAESPTPRNSHELAVRNQFFTPRYVVRFLTDNTLGRLWYEMRRGDTRIRNLDFIVHQPNEVLSVEVPTLPARGETAKEDPIGNRLQHQPPLVPFRAKKDPRDIRVVDPACGSGHFLLYAFDLFLDFYEEAWADEASPPSEPTGCTLRDDYPELASLQAAMPDLILRHNLHGIDIDARCAQMAGFALWMRAQRAYQEAGVQGADRPPIRRVNVVTAEPIHGGKEQLDQFLSTLDPDLSALMRRLLTYLDRAGHAGPLLCVDDELRSAIKDVYGESGDLFRAIDQERWLRAEEGFHKALGLYCEQADLQNSYRRRLFAEDAARGLAFVDLCCKKYDVALMNPPFGEASPEGDETVKDRFPSGQHDLAAAFLLLGKKLAGQVGIIATRSLMLMPAAAKWRTEVQEEAHFSTVADLGGGVLDAFVETFAAVLRPREDLPSIFFRCVDHEDKAHALRFAVAECRNGRSTGVQVYVRDTDDFCAIPLAPMAYWAPEEILSLFKNQPPFEPEAGAARTGLATLDNFRFLRCWWELPPGSPTNSGWRMLAKGGDSWPFFWDHEQRLNWFDDGRELKCFVEMKVGSVSRKIQAVQFYGRPAVTWIQRSQRGFCPRALPSGGIFDTKGPAAFPNSDADLPPILALFNSVLFQELVDYQSSFGSYHPGVVQRSPAPRWEGTSRSDLSELSIRAYEAARRLRVDETSVYFLAPRISRILARRQAVLWAQAVSIARAEMADDSRVLVDCFERIESAAHQAYGLRESADAIRRQKLAADRWRGIIEPLTAEALAQRFVLWALGGALGRWRMPHEEQELPGPFEHYPTLPPGMTEDLPFRAIVDDPGHALDLEDRIVSFIGTWTDLDEQATRCLLMNALADLGADSIREVCRGTRGLSLFDLHVKTYSASRRVAPVFWQLAPASRSYSVWISFHGSDTDTLYRLVGDLVGPKLLHEERRLDALRQESSSTPSASQQRRMEQQELFVQEIRTLRDDLDRVAPLWRPEAQDGVQINASLLWRSFSHHRAWQDACKSTWNSLCRGDYDWAHLAMHLWPERVVPKCAEDRSLAIGHGLEEVFWIENEDGKWQPRSVQPSTVEALIRERTSPAVKAALNDLLSAPAPVGTKKATRRRTKAKKGRSAGRSPARPEPSSASPATVEGSPQPADDATLTAVREAIASVAEGASKGDVLAATGLSDGEWNRAIQALLERGDVTRTGAKRGTRYHSGPGGRS